MLLQVLLDQLTFGPLCNAIFMSYIALVVEGEAWSHLSTIAVAQASCRGVKMSTPWQFYTLDCVGIRLVCIDFCWPRQHSTEQLITGNAILLSTLSGTQLGLCIPVVTKMRDCQAALGTLQRRSCTLTSAVYRRMAGGYGLLPAG